MWSNLLMKFLYDIIPELSKKKKVVIKNVLKMHIEVANEFVKTLYLITVTLKKSTVRKKYLCYQTEHQFHTTIQLYLIQGLKSFNLKPSDQIGDYVAKHCIGSLHEAINLCKCPINTTKPCIGKPVQCKRGYSSNLNNLASNFILQRPVITHIYFNVLMIQVVYHSNR